MRQRRWWRGGGRVAGVVVGLTALSLGKNTAAKVEPPALATFALVVGVNQSMDGDAATLRYADDDAVRFRDLFRTMGAQTYLLTRMDENTRRLYPASASDVPPRLEALQTTVAEIAAQVAAAGRRGQRTVFYLIYAGHGTAGDSGGYVTLEDARLGGSDLLARIIDPVAATETHVIVDACNSFFLVLDRGPGGQRRALTGFAQLGAIAQRRDIGLLLSTSSARESHEWAAFQAGVFSHEVRSGLYGAADADGDGVISYTEMAAFIDRANSAVPNERFRPEVFSRAPDGGGRLLDLRAAPSNRIEINGTVSGHYYLEDTSGVRLADFNSDAGVRLVRPSPDKLYLRRAGADDREFVLPPSATTLRTAALVLQESHAAVRGAANDAFNTLFALPFGTDVVTAYSERVDLLTKGAPLPGPRATGPGRVRRWAGAFAGVAGLALVSAGVINYLDARSLRAGIDGSTSQDVVAATNERVTSKNRNTALLLGAGAAAVGAGTL
ncbi:MAG TPA: caspase family protein, partial [Polyangia bacterium]|nr:caspase family protein [Polyangia bacterium]